jgi:hypothetical protein
MIEHRNLTSEVLASGITEIGICDYRGWGIKEGDMVATSILSYRSARIQDAEVVSIKAPKLDNGPYSVVKESWEYAYTYGGKTEWYPSSTIQVLDATGQPIGGSLERRGSLKIAYERTGKRTVSRTLDLRWLPEVSKLALCAADVCAVIPLDAVVLTKQEASRLQRRDDFLDRLEAAGVDNWEGYSCAFEGDEDDDEE